MAAAGYMLLKETVSTPKGKLIIGEVGLKCPECCKEKYVLNGKDDSGKQRYLCKLCDRRFGDNLGFEYRHTSPMFITLALMLNGAGMSPFSIRIMLGHLNVKVHVQIISDGWSAELAEKYTGPMQSPDLGSRLGADEKRQDVKGEENYFVMELDLATRFILAWETTADKMSHDATNLLKAAKAKAGKPHITDGLSGYHTAFKRVFGVLKGLFLHLCDIHMRNEFANTNKQAGVDSTFAGRICPGHKQRELAGLPHLHTVSHPPARRNRRQDAGRGSRH